MKKCIAIIGGSGLLSWGGENRMHSESTPYGPASAAVEVFERNGVKVLFLARHGKAHEIPPHRINYRANLWLLEQLGASAVLGVNAVGGITESAAPGRLIVPDQLIDYTWGREQTFADGLQQPLDHIEFEQPYQGALRRLLLAGAKRRGIGVVERGTIGITQGPRMETAAEVRRLQRDGCDLVGMTSMPEVALARELGLDYAGLCVSANWAAGLSPEPISIAAIERVLAESMKTVRQVIEAVIDRF